MYKSLKRQLSQKVFKERADFILGGGTPQVWAKRVPDGVELMEIYRFILTDGQTTAKAAGQILRAIRESDSKRRGPSTEEEWPQLMNALYMVAPATKKRRRNSDPKFMKPRIPSIALSSGESPRSASHVGDGEECTCSWCLVWRYLQGKWAPSTIDEFIQLANDIPCPSMVNLLNQLKAEGGQWERIGESS